MYLSAKITGRQDRSASGGHMGFAEGLGLQKRLDAILCSGTPMERAIASYLAEHILDLPFETAASLAQKIRVSEVSIGRFARALGYRNLKEIKEAMKIAADMQAISSVGDSPWLHGSELAARFAKDNAGLALEREIHAVMRNHDLATTEEFARCAKRLAHFENIKIAGFQTERGMAQYLAHNLSYLRPRVSTLEMDSGHFADVFLDDPQNTALVVIETRRYSQLAVTLVKKAQAEGIPVTVLTDTYCGWARAVANEVLQVNTDFSHFWDATGQIAGLINLLVNRVFQELGPGVEERLNGIARNYGTLVGHQR